MEYIYGIVAKRLPRTKSGIVKDFPVNPDSNGVYSDILQTSLPPTL